MHSHFILMGNVYMSDFRKSSPSPSLFSPLLCSVTGSLSASLWFLDIVCRPFVKSVNFLKTCLSNMFRLYIIIPPHVAKYSKTTHDIVVFRSSELKSILYFQFIYICADNRCAPKIMHLKLLN